MLVEGARRGHERITWVNGDAQHLPFPDQSFDAVTISFGLRNVPDPALALGEFARVLRPGGRMVVCEFANPTAAPLRAVYRRYLADSILAWPDRAVVAAWLERAGFREVLVKDLAFGVVAVHRGFRTEG